MFQHIPNGGEQNARKYLRCAVTLLLPIVVGVMTLALWMGSNAAAAPKAAAGPGGPSQPPAPECGSDWVIVLRPTPTPGWPSGLNGVAAISSNDVWAVGNSTNTLTEHWNGHAWSVVPSPNPTHDGDGLRAVAAVSSNDVWAVGGYYQGTALRTLAEHWNGATWSVVPSANPSADNELTSVAAISSNDVWAVGYYNDGPLVRTLAEHWNGSTWTAVPGVDEGSGNYLNGVAAVSSNDVWAVGSYYNGSINHTLVEHWNGSAWSSTPSPNPGSSDNELKGLAVASANDIWAVGDYLDSSSSSRQTLIERWNGTAWSVVSSPNSASGDNYLRGIAVASPNDIWAVGTYGDLSMPDPYSLTLVEHWDGSSWSIIPSPSPNPGPVYQENVLAGLAAASSNDIWSVGYFWDFTYGGDLGFVERYNPCSGTPTPTACSIQYSDVPPGSIYYPYIHCLACLGIINGYDDGTFRPNNNVRRSQLSKIVSNAAGFNDPQTTQMFEDVPLGSTFQVVIGRLASRGYISGYPCGRLDDPCVPPLNRPYFRPNDNATRGQISKIVSNVAGFNDGPGTQQFEDVPPGSAYYTYTYRLYSRDIMSGYLCGGTGDPCGPNRLPYFRPNNNATRGQTAKIVSKTFFPDCNVPSGP